MKYLITLVVALALSTSVFGQGKKDQKNVPQLKPEEIIARHVASIGTPEAINAAKSRVFVGQARLTSRVGYTGILTGQAQFASVGENVLLAAAFNSNEYPYEKAAFNGKDVSVGRPNGNSTPLGDFLKSNKTILREGLLGGVLSTAWPFLNKDNKFKFDNAGIAEIGGRSFYKLKTRIGDLSIVLYFDAENFRHAATEYSNVIGVGISRGNNPRPESDEFGTSTTTGMANQKQTYMTLTERFSNFAKSGDLTIPLTYVVDYTYQDSNSNRSLNLEVRFQEFYPNQELEPDVFKVS